MVLACPVCRCELRLPLRDAVWLQLPEGPLRRQWRGIHYGGGQDVRAGITGKR